LSLTDVYNIDGEEDSGSGYTYTPDFGMKIPLEWLEPVDPTDEVDAYGVVTVSADGTSDITEADQYFVLDNWRI
jgi:hypothetical protein